MIQIPDRGAEGSDAFHRVIRLVLWREMARDDRVFGPLRNPQRVDRVEVIYRAPERVGRRSEVSDEQSIDAG